MAAELKYYKEQSEHGKNLRRNLFASSEFRTYTARIWSPPMVIPF
jgi:hypothetical protein